MAATLASSIDVKFSWAFADAIDLSTVMDSGSKQYKASLASGTAVDTADRKWSDTRAVAGGANDDLDLTALAQSLFGGSVTINFAKVSGIFIVNKSLVSAEELVVKADATNGFTGWCDGVTTSRAFIGADSPWVAANKKDAWATSGSNKVLRIHNPNAGSVSFDVVILGRSL